LVVERKGFSNLAKVYRGALFAARRTGVGEMAWKAFGVPLLVVALVVMGASFQAPVAVRPQAAGTLSIAATVPITLHGDGISPGNGWGRTSTTITQPGPTIQANQSDTIAFSLFSADGEDHQVVIDFDRDGSQDSDERNSSTFSSSTTAVSFTWVADRAGTFQYYCPFHGQGAQRGTLIVNATATTPTGGDNTLLIVGGLIVVVVIVGAAAAMMMRKKSKPPMQPPSP
jgi:hypothetical protein